MKQLYHDIVSCEAEQFFFPRTLPIINTKFSLNYELKFIFKYLFLCTTRKVNNCLMVLCSNIANCDSYSIFTVFIIMLERPLLFWKPTFRRINSSPTLLIYST